MVEAARRKCVTVPGETSARRPAASAIIDRAVKRVRQGRRILVNNAAFQMTRDDISEIETEEFDHTSQNNLYTMFWLTKAAVPYVPERRCGD